MNWFTELFSGTGVAHALFILSLVIATGLLLGRIKVWGISLGVTWILFVGIVAGHFGFALSPEMSSFAKDLGLILFVYTIGLQVGPHFFKTFRDGGVKLNLLAVAIILLGDLCCAALAGLTGLEADAMIGILFGAVTNTPGLGAAQQTYLDITGQPGEQFAGGYAMAYPLAVIGLIGTIIVMRLLFRRRLHGPEHHTVKPHEMLSAETTVSKPNLFILFFGILLGVLLGSIPIAIPGMDVPVKLGLAGGPLIVAICLGAFGPKLHLNTYMPTGTNFMLRDLGIALFLATVGIDAGGGFVQTFLQGGYLWVLYGFLITLLPILFVGLAAYYLLHVSFYSVAGLLSGSLTDPPALAYSSSLCDTDEVCVAYSTVYPLSMFLRIISAQVLVLLMV